MYHSSRYFTAKTRLLLIILTVNRAKTIGCTIIAIKSRATFSLDPSLPLLQECFMRNDNGFPLLRGNSSSEYYTHYETPHRCSQNIPIIRVNSIFQYIPIRRSFCWCNRDYFWKIFARSTFGALFISLTGEFHANPVSIFQYNPHPRYQGAL